MDSYTFQKILDKAGLKSDDVEMCCVDRNYHRHCDNCEFENRLIIRDVCDNEIISLIVPITENNSQYEVEDEMRLNLIISLIQRFIEIKNLINVPFKIKA